MNQEIMSQEINLVKNAVNEELAINGDNKISIEELYQNIQIAGISFETIDKIVHDLADAGEFELI